MIRKKLSFSLAGKLAQQHEGQGLPLAGLLRQ